MTAKLASTSAKNGKLETQLDETTIQSVVAKERTNRKHSAETNREPIETVEQYDERSRGGGEHEISIYQQFMHAIEQRNMINAAESTGRTIATQM